MPNLVSIAEIMQKSAVQFGTSGARGLVTDMTDEVCYACTAGFIKYLLTSGELSSVNRQVALAGDLRASTPRIMTAVAQAIRDAGFQPVNCGNIPSPAVALFGIQQQIPAIMVTGSHIPEDRNGIKFNKASGEILKEDELGIMSQSVEMPDIFHRDGMMRAEAYLPALDSRARDSYLTRWLTAFPADYLAGRTLLLYQHSAVGRDLILDVLRHLGAKVHVLARSEQFIPVDTEAIRDEDVQLAKKWATEYSFDAVISTDGDSDRPLIADENGHWLRGDVAGILCAKFLAAEVVVTPVSSNSAVEKCAYFKQVIRTRIGSPYVIAAMQQALHDGAQHVVGYEANGGFFIADELQIAGRVLPPLPTRDPVIVALSLLGLAGSEQKSLSHLLNDLPQRFTASGRIQRVATEISQERIKALITQGADEMALLFSDSGVVTGFDTTDGLRIYYANDDIIHLRPSGNAPELRCYCESFSENAVNMLLHHTLNKLHNWLL